MTGCYQYVKPYEIVAERLNKMLRIDRAMKVKAYAHDVVERYLQNTLADKRDIAFYVGRDVSRDSAANAQIISRALQGIYADSSATRKTSILHITELQNSLIAAMVEPYKTQCLHALLSAFNVIPVSIPDAGDLDDMTLFIKFVEKVGEALTTLGLIMENKTMGPEDAAHKTKITTQLTDIKALADNFLGAIHEHVPDHPLSIINND